MSDFQVGDVVVCVDAEDAPMLRKRGIYQIEAIEVVGPEWSDEGTLGFYLYGLASSCGIGGFRADRFRKIDKADDSFIARIRACKLTARATSTPSHEQEVM